jgi:DNA-binding transcriptional regulator YdaS (Cro superfamily)
MKLSKYLAKKKMSQKAFADIVGVTESCISRINNGNRAGTVDTLSRIKVATKGKVTYNDMIPD